MSSTKGDKLEETQVFSGDDLSERILTQLATLRPDADLEDAVWALVSTFAEGLDELCVGVCVPQVGGSQLIVRHAPRPSRPRMHDAARLFPEASYEEIFAIPFDEGSTLHVGGDDLMDLALRRSSEQLALVIGSVVRRTRHIDELKKDAKDAKTLKDQAVQSDKLAGLGRMAASIVHELNNPLTSIVAYADFLRRRWEQEGVDAADRERLARISEAASRVLSFTRDLVAYSRPSTATPSSVDIHEVVERALVFCDHVLANANVEVVRAFAVVPPLHGLHGPLTQVFVNLVTNACQAMEPGGGTLRIETATTPLGDRVLVRVIDQGPGIQPDAIERLFDPYFTTRGDGGGSGLGLNIVQTIVASHGGSVTASNVEDTSATPSVLGAMFVVELPVRV
jgi:C4-dicarboxylate-specific signal transduction histidine kinase